MENQLLLETQTLCGQLLKNQEEQNILNEKLRNEQKIIKLKHNTEMKSMRDKLETLTTAQAAQKLDFERHFEMMRQSHSAKIVKMERDLRNMKYDLHSLRSDMDSRKNCENRAAPKPEFQIFVKVLGVSYAFKIHREDTVFDIKNDIEHRHDIPQHSYWLSFSGWLK